jgi:predicted nucleic acid-binding protein
MQLSHLPSKSIILADANILVYYFSQQSPVHLVCKEFVLRATRGEIQVFTSTPIVAEVIHRIMVAEAIERFNLLPGDAVNHLKRNPDAIRQLHKYRPVPSDIYNAGIRILPVDHTDLHRSREWREKHGLLTNDSLVVAVMKRHKIINLATNDPDFERIPGIQVWRPARWTTPSRSRASRRV